MSELITSDYYYGLEAEQYTFFRIPKILFSPTYKTLSVSVRAYAGPYELVCP